MSATLAELANAALIGKMEAYRNEVREVADGLTDEQLWRKPLEESNSIGHLILHLTGNLNYFVGEQLGKSGYVRDRDREFTETERPERGQLLSNLDAAVATFRRVVSSLSEEQLQAAHPEKRFGTVLEALIHILGHFALHRGQMSYIRRLVSLSERATGAAASR